LVSGIAPADRLTWWLEISWVIVGLAVLPVFGYLRIRLTRSLQIALFLHAVILIYGGWYTYEQVPLGEWMKEVFGWERNNYDRIGHFAQGLFPAVLAREILVRRRATTSGFWCELFVFALCMAFSAIFELIEYGSALAFGDASAAYLGSQGDVWDAQNDMLMCGIGALACIAAWRPFHLRELRRISPAASLPPAP
jgi:putative membrane protein